MTRNALPVWTALLVLLAACADDPADADAPDARGAPEEEANPQTAFLDNLREHCGEAYEGELLQAPDDQIDPDARLVVHFRECGDDELRLPLHVGEDRSRTWVFLPHDDALELRHDHRHEDGSEEENTWYGDFTLEAGSAERQEFVSDRNGVLGGWRVEIVPGERYTYGTIRDGEWRHHLEFDLTEPVEAPPPPWGHDVPPSAQ